MKQFFTHPATITIGIILSLGILALVGYNYWGWFGGSDGYIGGKGFPKNPKVGDKHFSLNDGKEYTYVCTQLQGGAYNPNPAPCTTFGWLTDKQIQEIPLPPRMASNITSSGNNPVEKTYPSSEKSTSGKYPFKEMHCDYKTPVIVNGIQYDFYNIGSAQGFPNHQSSTGYFVIYSNPSQNPYTKYFSIPKKDWDNWQSRACNPAPPAPNASCEKFRIDAYTQVIANANAVLAQGGLSQNTIKDIQSGIAGIQNWLNKCKRPTSHA